MTEKFKRYIYPFLHTNNSKDLWWVWRRLGIEEHVNLCFTCENKYDCDFRARGDKGGYMKCNFYERKEGT